jgi:hypothetical protein
MLASDWCNVADDVEIELVVERGIDRSRPPEKAVPRLATSEIAPAAILRRAPLDEIRRVWIAV